ncbi:MAG: type II toxin-antitoxin system VapC family toxin [Pirellulales bacterium]|nr:type II toxin-antitoxin system VapC family toxin [Pirellulales bacterium]
MIVLDASAALELLLRAPDHSRLVARVLRSGETIAAPHLLDLEVTQVLRRFVMAGEITAARGRKAIEDHLSLGIVRYPHEGLLERVWQLRANCTAYDAAYLVLAEALNAVLITCDAKLAAIPGSRVAVEVITASRLEE